MTNLNSPDQADDATVRRKFLTRGRVVTASLVVGLSFSVGSWLLRVLARWWSATLRNVTFAAFLLVPGELALTWLTSRFERMEHATDAVRETAEIAKETAEEAKQAADRVGRSIEEVRETLVARQRAEHEAELDAFRSLERDLSRSSVINALRQATEGELITANGVRVPVWETDLHYRFVLDNSAEELTVQLERDDGSVVSSHPWHPSLPVDDFFQNLVDAVREAGEDLGVGLNDPTQSIQELSEMLVEVGRLRAQVLMGYRDSLHKIIERREGWYFTEGGVVPEDDLRYIVPRSRLDEPFWEEHLRGKGWYGAGYSLHFARLLYGVVQRSGHDDNTDSADDAAE
jgi:hypothetical protein